MPHAKQLDNNATFYFPFLSSRTDHSLAFASCSQQSRCHHSPIPQPDAPLEVDTVVTPPLAFSPQFEDLDIVFGRHLPLADPIRVAVLLTGTLRNFLTLKRQVAALSITSSTYLLILPLQNQSVQLTSC
jgi:hypothetical protein